MRSVFFILLFLVLVSCGQGLVVPGASPSVGSASSVANGDGTVTVTVTGSGFVDGMTVTVNSTPCTDVHVRSSTQATCKLPNGDIALINIVVTTPSGGSGGSSVSSPLLSTTALSSGTASGGVNSGSWTSPSLAQANDGNSAQVSFTPSDSQSDYLKLTGYFSGTNPQIPSNATITGIGATCEWAKAFLLTPPFLISLKLVISGSASGTDKGANQLLTSPSLYQSPTFGAQNDTWGNSLTPALVNASNFGIQLQFGPGGCSFASCNAPKIDYCTLSVYFTQ